MATFDGDDVDARGEDQSSVVVAIVVGDPSSWEVSAALHTDDNAVVMVAAAAGDSSNSLY